MVVKDPASRIVPPQDNQPAIYYGENMAWGYPDSKDGALKNLTIRKGEKNVYTRYEGTGGIPLDSFWKKLLFAWHPL